MQRLNVYYTFIFFSSVCDLLVRVVALRHIQHILGELVVAGQPFEQVENLSAIRHLLALRIHVSEYDASLRDVRL